MQIDEYKAHCEQTAQEITDFINQKMKEFKTKTGHDISYISMTITPAFYLNPHPNVLEAKGFYCDQNVVNQLSLSTSMSSTVCDLKKKWNLEDASVS